MFARGNKLSSCKIPGKYLRKTKKLLNFRTLATLADEKRKEKKKDPKI